MVNSTKNKALVIFSVLVLSVVMVFGVISSTSSFAFANGTNQSSNETIEEDLNPEVKIDKNGWNNRYEIWTESSKTQYAWYGQKFTSNTFIKALKYADKCAPEEFWKDVEKGNPIKFIIFAYKYVGSNAITQAAINEAVASEDFKHKAEVTKNTIKINEILVTKPMWVEPHLEEENCFCNIASVEKIDICNGNFCRNAFGENMPGLKQIITENVSENYSEAEVKEIVNSGVQIGCMWDAKTDNPFTYNYRYTYDGTNWSKKRI